MNPKRIPIAAFLLAACFALSLAPMPRPQAQQGPPGSRALGSGACAASQCHGGELPLSDSDILRNEYRTWSSHDRHAQAYNVLLNETSRRIAANLGIGSAHESSRCLDCHAYNVAQARRAAMFRLSEGVGCEACHGASSNWLGPHALAGAERSALGMTESGGLRGQVELCLSCHLGDESKSVGHALIAAGHPALVFEFDTYSELMPRHWKATDRDWQGVRRWAVGQAVALRESMRQLARRAQGGNWDAWPDFADFECSSCHHALQASGEDEDFTPSARQRRGFSGRPGIPPWDRSRYIVLRQLLAVARPAAGNDLEQSVGRLEELLQSALENRSQTAQQAQSIAGQMDRLIPALENWQPDANQVRALLERLSSQAAQIGQSGLHAAQQATMAADALYAAYRANAAPSQQLDEAIERLYRNLQTSPSYDPAAFANLLGRIKTALE